MADQVFILPAELVGAEIDLGEQALEGALKGLRLDVFESGLPPCPRIIKKSEYLGLPDVDEAPQRRSLRLKRLEETY